MQPRLPTLPSPPLNPAWDDSITRQWWVEYDHRAEQQSVNLNFRSSSACITWIIGMKVSISNSIAEPTKWESQQQHHHRFRVHRSISMTRSYSIYRFQTNRLFYVRIIDNDKWTNITSLLWFYRHKTHRESLSSLLKFGAYRFFSRGRKQTNWKSKRKQREKRNRKIDLAWNGLTSVAELCL